MIRPTELVCKAAGVSPSSAGIKKMGSAWRCTMCGSPFEDSDPAISFAPGNSFTDYANLLAPNSDVICPCCQATWSLAFTQTYLKSVVTLDGVFPCASNDHIAYWLLNPPPPPFMMFIGDQKRQHVVWRTPVNTSQEVIVLRFGEQLLTVRPRVLREIIPTIQALLVATNAANKTKRKSLFASLSREIDSQQHGTIASDVWETVQKNPELAPLLRSIQNLTPGELWGLTAVLYAKNPHRPEPSCVPAPSTQN